MKMQERRQRKKKERNLGSRYSLVITRYQIGLALFVFLRLQCTFFFSCDRAYGIVPFLSYANQEGLVCVSLALCVKKQNNIWKRKYVYMLFFIFFYDLLIRNQTYLVNWDKEYLFLSSRVCCWAKPEWQPQPAIKSINSYLSFVSGQIAISLYRMVQLIHPISLVLCLCFGTRFYTFNWSLVST